MRKPGEGKDGARSKSEPEAKEDLPPGLARLFGGSFRQAGPSMSAVYGLVGALLGLGFVGWLADRRFGTSPRWLLTGLLCGMGIGLYGLARVVLVRR